MDPDLQDVVDRELRLLDPAVRRSRAAVDALLDPDFLEFGASGRIWRRDAILDALASPDDTPPTETADFTPTRLADDVVLLTYRSSGSGRTALRSSIWRRRDGQWRMAFHQGTVQPDA